MPALSRYNGEIGLQLVLFLSKEYTVPQVVELAEYAQGAGFNQLWIGDHVGSRELLTVLSAIASRVPMKLGTAIMVPYYRHPVVASTALASISELTSPHELSVGLSRGGTFPPAKPLTMLAETAQFLKRAFTGETIQYGDYPFLASYYNLDPEARFRMDFVPTSPILLYCGGNSPKSIAVGGRHMDGLLFGGPYLLLLRTGKLKGLLEIAEGAAREVDPGKRLRKVAEVNISLASDGRAAREFPRPYVANLLRQGRDATAAVELMSLGIDPADIDRVGEAWSRGATRVEAAKLVTDAMVDAMFIAGDVRECRERIVEVCEASAAYGFDQLSFSKLGPDTREAIQLLAREVLPAIRRS